MFTKFLLLVTLLDVFTISLQALLPFPPKYQNLVQARVIKNWQNLFTKPMSRKDHDNIQAVADQFVIHNLYNQDTDDDYQDNDIVVIVDKNYLKPKNQLNYEIENELGGSRNFVKNLLCKVAGDCDNQDTKLRCDCKKQRNMFGCECTGKISRSYDQEEENEQSGSYYRAQGKTLEDLLNAPEEDPNDTKSTMRCGCKRQYGYDGLRCGCRNKLRNGDMHTTLGDNYMQDILNAVQKDLSDREKYLSRTGETDQIEELRCGCRNRNTNEFRCGCRGVLRIMEKYDDGDESYDSEDETRNYNQYSTNYRSSPNQVQTFYLNNDDSKPKLNFLQRDLNEKVQDYGVPFEFDIQGMGQLEN